MPGTDSVKAEASELVKPSPDLTTPTSPCGTTGTSRVALPAEPQIGKPHNDGALPPSYNSGSNGPAGDTCGESARSESGAHSLSLGHLTSENNSKRIFDCEDQATSSIKGFPPTRRENPESTSDRLRRQAEHLLLSENANLLVWLLSKQNVCASIQPYTEALVEWILHYSGEEPAPIILNMIQSKVRLLEQDPSRVTKNLFRDNSVVTLATAGHFRDQLEYHMMLVSRRSNMEALSIQTMTTESRALRILDIIWEERYAIPHSARALMAGITQLMGGAGNLGDDGTVLRFLMLRLYTPGSPDSSTAES